MMIKSSTQRKPSILDMTSYIKFSLGKSLMPLQRILDFDVHDLDKSKETSCKVHLSTRKSFVETKSDTDISYTCLHFRIKRRTNSLIPNHQINFKSFSNKNVFQLKPSSRFPTESRTLTIRPYNDFDLEMTLIQPLTLSEPENSSFGFGCFVLK